MAGTAMIPTDETAQVVSFSRPFLKTGITGQCYLGTQYIRAFHLETGPKLLLKSKKCCVMKCCGISGDQSPLFSE